MSNRFSTIHGAYEVSSLPGQSQVAVTHGFMVPEDRRKRGHGHKLKADQVAMLQILNYDYALCTVAAENQAQQRILQDAGWQRLASFRNRRSSEITEIWGSPV